MKHHFLLFCFSVSLFSTGITGQEVKWSPALQDNKKVPYLLILGEDDEENFYVLRSNMSLEHDRERSGFRNRIYILQYYSSDLTLLWDKDLLTSYEDGHITDISIINGKVVVTSYILDKKSSTYYFYIQYISNTGNWTGKPALIDSFASGDFDEENKPGMIVSKDQAYMAFSYRKINRETKYQYYNVVLIDTNLSVKYKKEIEIPVSEQLFLPLESILTNQGSFFVLGIHYTTEKKVKAPEQSFYEIYGFNRPLDKTINTVIKSESKFLTDVGMVADNFNRSIVVAGFFSDKTTYSTAGVFYYALTEDSLLETKVINTPFSSAYLQKFFTEKKENRELVNFSIDRLIVRRDGGVALIAESRYETSRSYFDYYMQTFIAHTYYHYGNIMVLSVNPDGNILWNNVIAKDQNSIDDSGFFSSYSGIVTGGRLAAIYNKYIEDESSVLITYIEATGNQKTDVLFNEVEKVRIIPQSARQTGEETVLMPVFKQNKYYIIKVSF